MDFRPIYQALADRLATDLGAAVAVVSRENLPATSYPDQPALVVLASTLSTEGGLRTPVRWELGATLILYSKVDAEEDRKPDDKLLDLVARVRTALGWRAGEPRSDGLGAWTTLGGKVLWAQLDDAAIDDDPRDPAQLKTYMHVTMSVRE